MFRFYLPPYERHTMKDLNMSEEEIRAVGDEEDKLGFYYREMLEAISNGSLKIENMRNDT